MLSVSYSAEMESMRLSMVKLEEENSKVLIFLIFCSVFFTIYSFFVLKVCDFPIIYLNIPICVIVYP